MGTIRRLGRWGGMAICAIVALALTPAAFGQAAKKKPRHRPRPRRPPPGTDPVDGTLKLGYRTDARPFSFKDASGNPTGYSVTSARAPGIGQERAEHAVTQGGMGAGAGR